MISSKQKVQFARLNNGLRIAMWPLPHLHSVGIGVYAKVGSRYETIEHMGISHFLEHVLFRGNSRYPTSLSMNRDFESWGGSFNGFTTREYTYFYGRLHPDYLDKAVHFMADFLAEPTFEGVELERRIIMEERLEDVDGDGQDLEIDDIARQGLWGDHPLAHKIIGTPVSLKKIQLPHLKEHFNRYFGAKNLVVSVTGCFQPDAILPVLEDAFGRLPPGDLQAPPSVPSPIQAVKHPSYVTNESSQLTLQMTFYGPDPMSPDFASMLLLDRILDDGMSSRLWQRIVDEKGLCYDLWGHLDVYHDLSLFDVGGNVASDKMIALMEAIYGELRLFAEEGPTEEELALAKRRWRFSQDYALDQIDALNEALGASLLYDQYVSFEERQAQMERITRDDLKAFARAIFTPERHLVAAVGPLTKGSKKRLKELSETALR